MRGEREGDVRVALTVGVEGLRRVVVVLVRRLEHAAGNCVTHRDGERAVGRDDAVVDQRERRRVDSRISRATLVNTSASTSRHARSTAPPDIHVCRLAEVEPADPTAVSAAASTISSRPSTSRAICWASVTNPWPTSAHAQWTVTTPFSIAHTRGRVVVEAFGEEQVLEPDREADAALHVARAGRAPRAAGAGEVVVAVAGRQRCGRGRADHFGHRRGAPDDLTGHEGVARSQRVAQAQFDRIEAERRGELVHLGFVGEAVLHRAESPHRTARRVVRPHRVSVDRPRSERGTDRRRSSSRSR